MTEQKEPEYAEQDTCHPVEVDGEMVRVRGAAALTPESQHALAEVVRAGKRKMQADMAQEMQFVARVMEIFALADVRDYLLWHVKNGRVFLSVNVSDIFAWGGADAEDIKPETLPVLEQAWADTKTIDAEFMLPQLYAARVRGERPQGAAYPDTEAAQALFNACGPEREVGFGNPRPVPAAVDAGKADDR